MSRPDPNLLILMTDQMQGRVLEPGHPCRTPNLDALAARGTRVRRGYTPNPVCSPARASLMTGLLPHNHGVLHVTHTVDEDQSRLREDKPHFAQRLREAGYETGYFGKWHVERSGDLGRFGWAVNGAFGTPAYEAAEARARDGAPAEAWKLRRMLERPPGYAPTLLYGVTSRAPEVRSMGITVSAALDFLERAAAGAKPWCCFVSVPEPHDPFVAGEAAFAGYRPSAIPVPPNWDDPGEGKPGLYAKAAAAFAGLTPEEKRLAAACYYASITEIDGQFGRLLAWLHERGQADRTVVAVTSDHGELLGAHGLYMKNVSAYEEVYHVPMLVAGPGVAAGAAPDARAGLHELGPTLLEFAGAPPLPATDGRSFAGLLRDPGAAGEYRSGFAEYSGTRYLLTQRVAWEGRWKLVHNGFDEDELYDLEADPGELANLAADPAHRDRLDAMFGSMWASVRRTGDHSLLRTRYPAIRLAPRGPDA